MATSGKFADTWYTGCGISTALVATFQVGAI